MEQINRIKAILAEHNSTGKWLAEAMKKNEATVSRWCTNKSQPTQVTMRKIAVLLDIDVKDLLVSTK